MPATVGKKIPSADFQAWIRYLQKFSRPWFMGKTFDEDLRKPLDRPCEKNGLLWDAPFVIASEEVILLKEIRSKLQIKISLPTADESFIIRTVLHPIWINLQL